MINDFDKFIYAPLSNRFHAFLTPSPLSVTRKLQYFTVDTKKCYNFTIIQIIIINISFTVEIKKMAASDNSLFSSFLPTITKFDSFLGQGAFGFVLKAVDIFSQTTAVKFLIGLDQAEDEQEKNKILRECNFTQNLQKHSNIVQVINVEHKLFSEKDLKELLLVLPSDVKSMSKKMLYLEIAKKFTTIEAICIQMELCGEDLRQWLTLNSTTVTQFDSPVLFLKRITIVKNLISGLQFLHLNKIIHRDFKPENIMFSKQSFVLPVKIGDFGLSRKLHSEESWTGSLTSFVGTKSYMAPETRNSNYTTQADLFSLGLVIWEVTQFVGPGNFDKLVYDEEEDLVLNNPAMPGIREMIINLTKRKVAERHKTMDEVISVYNGLVDDYESIKLHTFERTESECEPFKSNLSIFSCTTIHSLSFIAVGESVKPDKGSKSFWQRVRSIFVSKPFEAKDYPTCKQWSSKL